MKYLALILGLLLAAPAFAQYDAGSAYSAGGGGGSGGAGGIASTCTTQTMLDGSCSAAADTDNLIVTVTDCAPGLHCRAGGGWDTCMCRRETADPNDPIPWKPVGGPGHGPPSGFQEHCLPTDWMGRAWTGTDQAIIFPPPAGFSASNMFPAIDPNDALQGYTVGGENSQWEIVDPNAITIKSRDRNGVGAVVEIEGVAAANAPAVIKMNGDTSGGHFAPSRSPLYVRAHFSSAGAGTWGEGFAIGLADRPTWQQSSDGTPFSGCSICLGIGREVGDTGNTLRPILSEDNVAVPSDPNAAMSDAFDLSGSNYYDVFCSFNPVDTGLGTAKFDAYTVECWGSKYGANQSSNSPGVEPWERWLAPYTLDADVDGNTGLIDTELTGIITYQDSTNGIQLTASTPICVGAGPEVEAE